MIQLDIPDVRIKPYVRMTQRGKYVNKQAQEYLSSKNILMTQIRNQMQLHGLEMLPGQTPFKVIIRLYASFNPGHKCDLDNQIKAILDACNKVIFPDDRWVDQIDAQRYFGTQERLMLTVFRIGR